MTALGALPPDNRQYPARPNHKRANARARREALTQLRRARRARDPRPLVEALDSSLPTEAVVYALQGLGAIGDRTLVPELLQNQAECVGQRPLLTRDLSRFAVKRLRADTNGEVPWSEAQHRLSTDGERVHRCAWHGVLGDLANSRCDLGRREG